MRLCWNRTPIATATNRNEHILLFLKLHQHPAVPWRERQWKRKRERGERERDESRHGSHTSGRLINHRQPKPSRSPDEWEAAGKLLTSLHQTDVLKVSNQCSPQALLPCTPPSSSCSPLHGVRASPPHGIVGARFDPSQHSGKDPTLYKLQGAFCAQSCSTDGGGGREIQMMYTGMLNVCTDTRFRCLLNLWPIRSRRTLRSVFWPRESSFHV